MIRLALFALVALVSSNLSAQIDAWSHFPGYPEGCWNDQEGDHTDDWEARYNEASQFLGGKEAELSEANDAEEETYQELSKAQKAALVNAYQRKRYADAAAGLKADQDFQALQIEAAAEIQRLDARYEALVAEYSEKIKQDIEPLELRQSGLGTSTADLTHRESLTRQREQDYEEICAQYFSSRDSLFRDYLAEYKAYLTRYEIPINTATHVALAEAHGAQQFQPTDEISAVIEYIDRCNSIFGMRLRH
jgi:hypothetical protein